MVEFSRIGRLSRHFDPFSNVGAILTPTFLPRTTPFLTATLVDNQSKIPLQNCLELRPK